MSGSLIVERTGKSMTAYLQAVIRFIKKTYTARNVLHGLGDALDDRQKNWARDHLIAETILELEKRL